MEIRKQIKHCVFNLFDNLARNINNDSPLVIQSNQKHKKKNKFKTKNIFNEPMNLDLFGSQLVKQLGMKRMRDRNSQFILPDFLRNSKSDVDNLQTYLDFNNEKTSEFLINSNHKHIIVSKHIFDPEPKEKLRKDSHNSPEHGDASKTEDEEKNEQFHHSPGLEAPLPLTSSEFGV